MAHLLDRGALEQHRQRLEALVGEMEMKVHVLMDGLQFVAHGHVQQFDAMSSIHTRASATMMP